MPDISPYLIVPAVTVIVSQVIKFAIHAFSNEVDPRQLLKFGGVPSSRVAVVSSLMVTALAVDGIGASVAGLTLAMGCLYIWEKAAKGGHREILIGSIVGVLSGLVLSVVYWRDDVNWLFDNPSGNEIRNQFIIFGVAFVAGEVLSYLTRRKSMRKLPTSRKLNRAIRLSLTLPAVVGLLFTFAQQQTLGMFDSRIWTYLVYLWVILVTIWFWWSVYRHAKAHLAEEAEHFKKSKVKEKTKRKKSKKKRR